MDKAEIEKILEDFSLDYDFADRKELQEDAIAQATSSLTALIIKWLEGKKYTAIDNSAVNLIYEKGRNQLITELVEELK